MPVEIRELIIKTTIENNASQESKRHGNSHEQLDQLQRHIIDRCKMYIDQKIKQGKER